MGMVRSTHDVDAVRETVLNVVGALEAVDVRARAGILIQHLEPLYLAANLEHDAQSFDTAEPCWAGVAAIAREVSPEPHAETTEYERFRLHVYLRWADAKFRGGDVAGARVVAREGVRLGTMCEQFFPEDSTIRTTLDGLLLRSVEVAIALQQVDEALALMATVKQRAVAGGSPSPIDVLRRSSLWFLAHAERVLKQRVEGTILSDDDTQATVPAVLDALESLEPSSVPASSWADVASLVGRVMGAAVRLSLPEARSLLAAGARFNETQVALLREGIEQPGLLTEKNTFLLRALRSFEPDAEHERESFAALRKVTLEFERVVGAHDILALDAEQFRLITAFDDCSPHTRGFHYYACNALLRAGSNPLDLVDALLNDVTPRPQPLLVDTLALAASKSRAALEKIQASEVARAFVKQPFTEDRATEDLRALFELSEEESVLVVDPHGGRAYRVIAKRVSTGPQLAILLSATILGPARDGLIEAERPSLSFLREFYGSQQNPPTQEYRRGILLYQRDSITRGQTLDASRGQRVENCLDDAAETDADSRCFQRFSGIKRLDGERVVVIATDLSHYHQVAPREVRYVDPVRILAPIVPSVELREVFSRANAQSLIRALTS